MIKHGRAYLDISYADRAEAERRGAVFDASSKLWYVNAQAADFSKFEQWIPKKIYLDVPFEEKDDAKSLGAKWDGAFKKWWVVDGTDLTPFCKWRPKKIYLEVPFEQKDDAKSLGAKFDGTAKKWWVIDGTDLAPFRKWLSRAAPITAASKRSIETPASTDISDDECCAGKRQRT